MAIGVWCGGCVGLLQAVGAGVGVLLPTQTRGSPRGCRSHHQVSRMNVLSALNGGCDGYERGLWPMEHHGESFVCQLPSRYVGGWVGVF